MKMKYLLVAIFVLLYHYKSHCSLPLFCIEIIASYAKAFAGITFLELRIQKFALRCNIMQHVNATDCNHGHVQGDADNVRNKSSIARMGHSWNDNSPWCVRLQETGKPPFRVFRRWSTSLPLCHVSWSTSLPLWHVSWSTSLPLCHVSALPLSQQTAVGIKVIQNLFLFLQRTMSCVANLKTNR